MNCNEVVELIQRYVDLDLTEAEQHALLSHLNDCPECAELFEKMKMLSNQLESLPEVTPPFNIVDSILPKLKEMGLFPEESAAMESDAEQTSPVLRRRRGKRLLLNERSKRSWGSWRSVLGGMAAGIVLGMFLFKHDVVMLQQRAEDLLMPNRNDRAADASAAGQKDSVKDKQKIGSSQPGKNTPKGTENGEKFGQAVVPVAPGEPPKTGEASPSFGTASPGLGGIAVLEPTPGSEKAAGSSGLMKLPADSGKREGAETPASQESAPDTSLTSVPEQTPQPSANDTTSAAPPIAEANPAPAPSSGGPVYGIRAFDSNHAPFVSPGGLFSAVIKDQTVVITDKNGNEVFRSPSRWKDDDTIRLTSWNGDSMLSYQVKSADGTETSFTIDTEAKTEKKN